MNHAEKVLTTINHCIEHSYGVRSEDLAKVLDCSQRTAVRVINTIQDNWHIMQYLDIRVDHVDSRYGGNPYMVLYVKVKH
jgi:CTP-dependent riboflavin kinase